MFKQLWDEATKTLVRTIAVGAVGSLLVVGGVIWAAGEGWLRSHVVGMVTADLTGGESRLADAVRNMIVSELQAGQSKIAEAFDSRMAQSLDAAFADRVGAVSAGRFNLDAANSRHVIFVYLPPGHDGHLYVATNGIASGERVIMNAPQASRSFTQNTVFEPLEIAALLDAPDDPQAEAISDVVVASPPIMGEMKHLHRLDFRLTHDAPSAPRGREAELPAELSSNVDMRYLTIVSPPLRRALP